MSAQLFALLAGPVVVLATYGLIRLAQSLLDFAGRQLANEALSHDPYGNDRILGDWPRAMNGEETLFHGDRNITGRQ